MMPMLLNDIQGEKEIRIGHVVSCFLSGHEYEPIGARDGHNEYACLYCGHPLLFEEGKDSFAGKGRFLKKVRYLCNLFGHRTHEVTQRHGYTEYACDCGHSFLKREPGLNVVKHPPICTFAGHFIHFVEIRGDLFEYVCRNCGHTFLFEAERGKEKDPLKLNFCEAFVKATKGVFVLQRLWPAGKAITLLWSTLTLNF